MKATQRRSLKLKRGDHVNFRNILTNASYDPLNILPEHNCNESVQAAKESNLKDI